MVNEQAACTWCSTTSFGFCSKNTTTAANLCSKNHFCLEGHKFDQLSCGVGGVLINERLD